MINVNGTPDKKPTDRTPHGVAARIARLEQRLLGRATPGIRERIARLEAAARDRVSKNDRL
jgi:hypothetical protein